MQRELTAVFQNVPGRYTGFVEELPRERAGNTLEEARSNLREAIVLVLATNRCLTQGAVGRA